MEVFLMVVITKVRILIMLFRLLDMELILLLGIIGLLETVGDKTGVKADTFD